MRLQNQVPVFLLEKVKTAGKYKKKTKKTPYFRAFFIALNQIRIVLCSTSYPGNIGSVARAMGVMGFSQLTLVNPKEFPSDHADALAVGCKGILDNAKIYTNLSDIKKLESWSIDNWSFSNSDLTVMQNDYINFRRDEGFFDFLAGLITEPPDVSPIRPTILKTDHQQLNL